jgi:hypothetical protein
MRSLITRATLLCLATGVISMASASAAMAVKISPANAKIQLKATNMSLNMGWAKSKPVTCELWQTSGKINATGTLPVSLEVPSFGKGTGECTVDYFENFFKGKVIEARVPVLEASSKTAASLSHGGFTIQLEQKYVESCMLDVGDIGPAFVGTWANGTIKEGKVTPSTLTVTNEEVTAQSAPPCSLWREISQNAEISATFTVTDTTEPSKVVVLE